MIDIGCGTGEIAFLLAQQGHFLFCFEPSEPMYTLFLERLRVQKSLHTLVSAFPIPLEQLDHPIQADLAYASSVFSHLSKESKGALLQSLSRHLDPDGLLIFNSSQYSPHRLPQKLELVSLKKVGEILFQQWAQSEALDNSTYKIKFKFDLYKGSQILKTYEDDFLLYCESKQNMVHILESNGFQVIETFSDFEKNDYQKDAPNFVMLAKMR